MNEKENLLEEAGSGNTQETRRWWRDSVRREGERLGRAVFEEKREEMRTRKPIKPILEVIEE